MAEFGIYSAWFEEGVGFLEGRCHEGPLSVGDSFVVAFEEDERGVRRNARPVDLRIERITAYGHDLDQLDRGVTAELTVKGEAVDLANDTVVSTTPQS